jgi:hypothetical protein
LIKRFSVDVGAMFTWQGVNVQQAGLLLKQRLIF